VTSPACLARRAAWAVAFGLAALLPLRAGAAGLDCATPADAFQRTVCADPSLSALDAEVAVAFRAMGGIPWRRGLRERHEAAMDALRRTAARDPGAIRQGLQARLAALREENGWSTTHGLEEAPEQRLRTACLALPSSEGPAAQRRACRVAEFRSLGTLDGRRYAFALYEYPPHPAGELANETAVLILAAGQPGEWTVEIAERLAEATCERPRLLRHGQESLLHLPCAETGTAGGAIPLLYRRVGPASFRRWQEVEAEGWQAALSRHLPAGTEVRGAVRLDPGRMTAAFALWREADPGCCPTGGRAEARLALEGDRLVLRDVALLPPR